MRDVCHLHGLLNLAAIVVAEYAEAAVPRVSAERDEFAYQQAIRRRGVLRQVSDTLREFARLPRRNRFAVETDRTRTLHMMAREQTHQARLSRSVVTNETRHALARNRQIDIIQPPRAADVEPDLFQF